MTALNMSSNLCSNISNVKFSKNLFLPFFPISNPSS